MMKVNIAAARKFSLSAVQSVPVVTEADLGLDLLCFEAGQKTAEMKHNGTTVYQVIEGEAIVRTESGREVAGSGRLISVARGQAHTVENAGGGLLVVLAARAEPG